MLLWIDGFEGYGSSVGGPPAPTGIIGRRYPLIAGESAMDIETGRYGAYCLEILDNNNYLQTPHVTTDATMVVGIAVKVNGLPSLTRELFYLYENTNKGMLVKINSDGTLSVFNNTTLLSTSSNQISSGTWYYLEFKVVTDNSTGSYELRIDNADWTSDTGVDTQPASNPYHTAVRLSTPFAIWTQWDDMYVLDSTGSANNNFLGNRQVAPLRPNANGDTNDWTPSTGNNYENVDEVQSDGDTTYNETNTANDIDLYNFEDASGLTTINGIMIMECVRVTTGSMDLKTLIKSGGTTEEGSAETVTSTSYITKERLSEQDPNTSAAWTQAGLNAAQFGVKAE